MKKLGGRKSSMLGVYRCFVVIFGLLKKSRDFILPNFAFRKLWFVFQSFNFSVCVCVCLCEWVSVRETRHNNVHLYCRTPPLRDCYCRFFFTDTQFCYLFLCPCPPSKTFPLVVRWPDPGSALCAKALTSTSTFLTAPQIRSLGNAPGARSCNSYTAFRYMGWFWDRFNLISYCILLFCFT